MPQKYRCINWALKLKACFKCVDVQCTGENWNSRPGFLHCYRQTLPCFCNLTESENSPELKGPCKTIYEKGEPRCDYHIPEEIMWFVKRSTCLSFKWKVKLLKLYLAVLSCSILHKGFPKKVFISKLFIFLFWCLITPWNSDVFTLDNLYQKWNNFEIKRFIFKFYLYSK